MSGTDKTIYKTCREAAGYTQERAAELLNLSVRHLARIEAGEMIPSDDIAYSMVVLYDSQYLAVQHLRSASQLAAAILPPVEQTTLQAATIRLFNSFSRTNGGTSSCWKSPRTVRSTRQNGLFSTRLSGSWVNS